VVRGFDSFPSLDIVHLDAHLDFDDHRQGIRWTAGNPIRRSAEFPWVKQITQIGMRMSRTREPVDDARARGNRIITTDEFFDLGPEAVAAKIPESDAIYVSFDIDIMDPTVCPGTQAPEAGGLNFFDMRSLLRAIARRGRIVGMDLVEVAPPLDRSGLTTKCAGMLLIDFLAAIVNIRRGLAPLPITPAVPV
jgi:agmatinase